MTRDDAIRLVLRYKAARMQVRDCTPGPELMQFRTVGHGWEGDFQQGERKFTVSADPGEVGLVRQCTEWLASEQKLSRREKIAEVFCIDFPDEESEALDEIEVLVGNLLCGGVDEDKAISFLADGWGVYATHFVR